MTNEVIFSKQTVDGFILDNIFGAFAKILSGAFTLTAGQYYEIGWDGKTYTRKAYTVDGNSTVYIGNELRQKGEIGDITEPFIVAYVPGTSQNLFYAYDISSSHIVGISTADEPPSVLLKDWHGKEHEFTGYDTVYIRNRNGDAQPYTHGLLGSNIETPADFSGGDMILYAEDGDFLKKVTVLKPENLTPEYIKKGVNIGGIVGNFAGDIMNKTVSLSMADGDQVITADTNTVLTSVTVRKPSTLKPENIVKGVNIGGVVGTVESYPDAHRVTFKNGNAVLYKRTVADGDDCADVISRGLIQTPTKDNLTFAGWSSTDGGAIDADALKAVTEDRTVYAVFTDTGLYGTNLRLEYVHNATQNGKNIEVI